MGTPGVTREASVEEKRSPSAERTTFRGFRVGTPGVTREASVEEKRSPSAETNPYRGFRVGMPGVTCDASVEQKTNARLAQRQILAAAPVAEAQDGARKSYGSGGAQGETSAGPCRLAVGLSCCCLASWLLGGLAADAYSIMYVLYFTIVWHAIIYDIILQYCIT